MWVLCILFMAIASIGVFGNTIVLFVIGFNRNLHDSTNLLIGNLALADLLFLTFCVPLTAYSYIHPWAFSESLCYITISLQYVTCYVSVWSLVFLSYDRYLAIQSPTKLRSIRRGHKSIYVCVIIWILAFVVNWPNMQGVGLIEQQFNGTVERYCVDSLEIGSAVATKASARAFFWSFNLLAYLLPLTMSVIFYMLLVKALWKEKMAYSKSSQRMKRHATKMVFTVILTFGICWLPQNMRFFLRGLSYPDLGFWEENESVLLVAQSFAQILAYANSALNPVLYSILSERFRKGLKHSWYNLCAPSRRSSTDTYYKQTIYDSNYSRARSPKCYSPEQHRRSLNTEGRYLMAKEISSIMGSTENILRIGNPQSQLLFQKAYKAPLVPRSPIVQPESSSVRDSSAAGDGFPAVLV